MITSNQPKMSGPGVPAPDEIMIDSHDVKPSNVFNGAKLREIDTGKKFRYNEETATWDEQPSGGGGSSTLSALTDVDISNPTDGQTLVYNASAGKWENGAGGASSGFTLLQSTYDNENFQFVLPVTAAELFTLMSSSMVAFRGIKELGDDSENTLYYLISARKPTYDGETRYWFVTGDGLSANDLGANDIVTISDGF